MFGLGLGFRSDARKFLPNRIANLSAWYRFDQGLPAIIDPGTISGIVARYRADQGITLNGSKVSAWNDISGVNDATHNLAQATAANQPTFIASDPAYNYNATLSFTAANVQYLKSSVWSTPVAQPSTIVIIGNTDGTAVNQYFSDDLNVNNQAVYNANGSSAAAIFAGGGGAALGSGSLTASPLVAVGIFNGASSNIYVKSNVISATGNPGSLGRTGIVVGAAGSFVAPLNGKIAEVLVFNRALTNQEVVNINAYAANRYGFTNLRAINQINDISGSGDANKNAAQATIAQQPTLNATDAAYNGMPTLNFVAGSNQLLASSAWTNSLSSSTIFVVGSDDGNTGANEYFMDGIVGNSQLLQAYQGKYEIYAGAAVQSPIAQTAAPKIFCNVFNGASSAIYINSFAPSLTGNVGIAPMTGITVGNHGGGGYGLNGKIAEIICYSRILSSDEIRLVTNYLSNHYAIPVQDIPKVLGLVAQYRADSLVTTVAGKVSAWGNLVSGDSNTNLIQNTSANQPTLVSSKSMYNSMPVINFNSANSQFLQSGTWASSVPTPRTFIAIADFASLNGDTNPYMIDGLTASSNVLGTNVSAGSHRAVIYSGTPLADPGARVNDTPLIVVGIMGSSGALYVDSKTSVITGTTGTTSLTGLTVGGISTAYFTGNIAEILVYNRVLSQDEINEVIDYARARYFPTPALPGLVAWYDAAKHITLNGSTVSSWGDSAFTADANKTLNQATAAKQPTYIASDPNYNGKPTLQFVSANSQFMFSGTWTTALNQPSTVIMVGNSDGSGATQYWKDGLVIDSGNIAATANDLIYAGTVLSAGATNASPKIIAGIYNGASSVIYRSQKTGTSGNAGTTGVTGFTLGSGGAASYPAGVNTLNGKIAEALVFNRALSNEEVGLVMTYLGQKYNINIGA